MALQYVRTIWKNRRVQRPRTYTEQANSDGSRTDTPAPGLVEQEGTPLNEDNLNNIEAGIVALVNAVNAMQATMDAFQAALAAYNTRIQNNERGISDAQTVNEQQSAAIVNLTRAHNALAEDEEDLEEGVAAHAANRSNPHGVTKAQVGLGNVPNVVTNDQQPTFSETLTGTTEEIHSGERLNVLLEKIGLAVRNVKAHIANASNPHAVTPAQIGAASTASVTALNQQIAGVQTRIQSAETRVDALENPTARKQELTLEAGWRVWHGYPNETLRVVRVGETVFLQGLIENTKKISSLQTSALKVATLPEWARPARVVDIVCQGIGRCIFLLCARTNGDLDVQRYRLGDTYPEIESASMFAMTAQWIAADAIDEAEST